MQLGQPNLAFTMNSVGATQPLRQSPVHCTLSRASRRCTQWGRSAGARLWRRGWSDPRQRWHCACGRWKDHRGAGTAGFRRDPSGRSQSGSPARGRPDNNNKTIIILNLLQLFLSQSGYLLNYVWEVYWLTNCFIIHFIYGNFELNYSISQEWHPSGGWTLTKHLLFAIVNLNRPFD